MRLRLGTINMSFNLQAGGLYRLKRRSQGINLVISGICWSQLGLREPTRPRLCDRSDAIFREFRGGASIFAKISQKYPYKRCKIAIKLYISS